MMVMTSSTCDSSPLLLFRWWELLRYKLDDSAFPSNTPEAIGHFVGFSENVGHHMMVKILTLDTLKVIHHANVRSAELEDTVNWCAVAALDGEDIPVVIKSVRDKLVPACTEAAGEFKTSLDGNSANNDNKEIKAPGSPIIPIENLIGRTFLMDENSDGEKHRARIVEAIGDQEHHQNKRADKIKFLCSINNEQYEDILSYNEIIKHIENHEDDTRVWKFCRIVSHEGPIDKRHPNWRRSSYNVMIEWENGEITREPLSIIAADHPVTCAIYAREQDLLNKPGWKRFKSIAKRQKKLFHSLVQLRGRPFLLSSSPLLTSSP